MEYQALPLDLVAVLPELPVPVYLRREGRMVLYALPGADLGTVLGRAQAGLDVHVQTSDQAALRRLLIVMFARALQARAQPPTVSGRPPLDLGRPAIAFASALMGPLFDPRAVVDAAALAAAQAAVDLLREALVGDPALGRRIIAEQASRTAPTVRTTDIDRHVGRALDGLVCAVGLWQEVGEGAAGPSGATVAELAYGAAFRDLGLARLARGADARVRAHRGGPGATARHPALGVELLTAALGCRPGWTSLVADHHERIDGSGYPLGKRGDEISRAARIVGLADMFATLIVPGAWASIRSADEVVRALPFTTRGRADEDLVWALIRLLGSGRLLPPRRSPTAH